MIKQKLIRQFVVGPCGKVDLKRYVTDWTETDNAKELGKDAIKERAAEIMEESVDAIGESEGAASFAINGRRL